MEKINFWDCDKWTETLQHDNKNSAIESYLDGLDNLKELITNNHNIEVFGYSRKIIPEIEINRIIETVIERIMLDLDEEYGDPENITEITEAMEKVIKEQIKPAIRKFLKKYPVWQCEQVITKKVNVKKWVKKNCPHWLEEFRL